VAAGTQRWRRSAAWCDSAGSGCRQPGITASREPVIQFRGLGFGIQVAGLAAWPAFWWAYDFAGAAVGAAVCVACLLLGRAKSKPSRCGNCKTPLATAKVRVCPGCGARLVDLDPGG